MANKHEILGSRYQGAEMLGSEAVREIFTLRRLGWGTKRIARELGLARNTVRDWLRNGADRTYALPGQRGAAGRAPGLDPGALPGRGPEWRRHPAGAVGQGGRGQPEDREPRPGPPTEGTGPGRPGHHPLRNAARPPDAGRLRREVAGGRRHPAKALRVRGHPGVLPANLRHGVRLHAAAGLDHGHRGGLPSFRGRAPGDPLGQRQASVLRQQGGRAVFHPEFAAFCSHWGVRPRACQPYRARTKGKVENGVGYVKGNALGSLSFRDDAQLDQHLVTWMREVADLRIHGTTHERPLDRFNRSEQAALSPVGAHPSYLRQRRFLRKVAVDARVEVDTNRYSVPGQFLGETVEVVIEADRLQVHWRDRVIAEHEVATGRYQSIVDPGHAAGLPQRPPKQGQQLGILRDLSVYERVVGGEA